MGDTPLYEELVELIIRISDHLLAAYKALQKRVRKAMGGEVLELWRERAERLEREAEARGIEQGIERGVDGLASKLRELGIDEELLNEAVSSLEAERKKD